jgi:hypothetical protein
MMERDAAAGDYRSIPVVVPATAPVLLFLLE